MKKNLAITFAIAIVAIFAIVACSNSVVAKSKVATPTLSESGVLYTSKTEVSISCSTVGSTIYYTIGGDSKKYSGPFTFDKEGSYTVKAVATCDGYEQSDSATAVYVVTDEPKEPTSKATLAIKGGKFIVHFEKPQEVEEHYFKYDDITIVSYYTCKTARPEIVDLTIASSLQEWINGLSLVAVGDIDNNVCQDFAIAITTDGGVLEFVRAICAQILGLAEIDINVVFGEDGSIIVETEDDSLDLSALIDKIVKLVPSIQGNIGIHITNNWEGLAISPIYLTSDLYGLLIDAVAQNVTGIIGKGIDKTAPCTKFAVYYNNGVTACEPKTLEKVSANLEYFYDIYSDTLYFADNFSTVEDYFKGKNEQIFKDGMPIIQDWSTATDTDFGVGIERTYYDRVCGILVTVTDFSTRTDTDLVYPESTTRGISQIPVESEKLKKDITYTIKAKNLEDGSKGKIFAITGQDKVYEIKNFMKDYYGVKYADFNELYSSYKIAKLGKDLIKFAMASKDGSISGFKNTFTKYSEPIL